MKLFRQIAESGRTVILTTHAMENVKLFDKIVVLMRGKLVFYGAPQEALAHVKAESFKDLYDKLEAPIDQQLASLAPLPPNAPKGQKAARKKEREQISEQVADDWKRKFQQTEQYRPIIPSKLALRLTCRPVLIRSKFRLIVLPLSSWPRCSAPSFRSRFRMQMGRAKPSR